jgi:hypothetical protein
MGISAGVWFLVFAVFLSLVSRSGGNENFIISFAPLVLLGSFVGFLVTALVLWIAFYVAGVLRSAISGKAR